MTVKNINQLTVIDARPLSYDANAKVTDDGVHTYQWNTDNQLLKIGYKPETGRSTEFRSAT